MVCVCVPKREKSGSIDLYMFSDNFKHFNTSGDDNWIIYFLKKNNSIKNSALSKPCLNPIIITWVLELSFHSLKKNSEYHQQKNQIETCAGQSLCY